MWPRAPNPFGAALSLSAAANVPARIEAGGQGASVAFHDSVDRLAVEPAFTIARLGGGSTFGPEAVPAAFRAVGFWNGPDGARVTLTAGVTAVETIWDHLKNDIGFAEVGCSPVTSGPMTAFNLDGDELPSVFEGMKALGRRCRREALEGRNIGFSNMHQLMRDLWEGRSKALPCGAGEGVLAVDHEGGLNLCHRFTGSDTDLFGDVRTGIEKDKLAGFTEARADRSDKGCATCRIHNLCSGGGRHESYAHFSDPLKLTYHDCDLMRDWVDFWIEVYEDLIEKAPRYFANHTAPRRANGK